MVGAHRTVLAIYISVANWKLLAAYVMPLCLKTEHEEVTRLNEQGV
jgi:hypothetical protein